MGSISPPPSSPPSSSSSQSNNNNNNNNNSNNNNVIMPYTPSDFNEEPPPNLNGYHFRITALQAGFDLIISDKGNGKLEYSGYLISILEQLSREDRGNFTYELLPPSGYGSKCNNRLDYLETISTTTTNNNNISFDNNNNNNNNSNITTTTNSNSNSNSTATPQEEEEQQQQQLLLLEEARETIKQHPEAYHKRNFNSYQCGESDVNDRPLSPYSTDMYWGPFYITEERIISNDFTIPYSPPDRVTLGMVGTATHIRNIPDLAQRNHEFGYNVCAYENTAYLDSLIVSFPTLDIQKISHQNKYVEIFDGRCDVLIGPIHYLYTLVSRWHITNRCIASNGKPVGVIGDPLDYGYNYFAFGVRDDLPDVVLRTLNYWLMTLMACFPDDPNGACPRDNGGGSLSELYEGLGGNGYECGYIQFPPPESDGHKLSPGIIAAIVLSPIVLIVALMMLYHNHRLKSQEKRMKKRFIQQLARNIDIGPSAHHISAEKLASSFRHIGGTDGLISKEDLAKWMNDLHLDFLSEKDFDRLWETLDMDGKGVVDPIDFVTFLSECGPQFKEVYTEYAALPKIEKMKLSQRRLTHIESMGEEEVLKMERRNEKRSRRAIFKNSYL